MKKGFAVSLGHASGTDVKCSKMGKKSNKKNHKGLEAIIFSLRPRKCSMSSVSTSDVMSHSHQRRWSADFCKCDTSHVIIVRKNKKEPEPPERSVSLLRSNTAPPSSHKRYSCPPTGIFNSPSRSSSSSSSTNSSCSSPPPVKTSVITGHDPLGWKLHPKSNPTSPRTRANRLSLQIPLPVIFPEPKSTPATNSQSDNNLNTGSTHKTKPPLRPKPSRRHHSDSSAFLKSLANPTAPTVALEELRALHLHPVTLSDESDDVFSDRNEEQIKSTAQPRKIPPPVPHKTSMARQIAQLIAHSRQRCKPVTNKVQEDIYARVIKPHQTVGHSSLHATKTAGLRLDTSCNRERPTPRFPGREI